MYYLTLLFLTLVEDAIFNASTSPSKYNAMSQVILQTLYASLSSLVSQFVEDNLNTIILLLSYKPKQS